jgi:hypothetical protein
MSSKAQLLGLQREPRFTNLVVNGILIVSKAIPCKTMMQAHITAMKMRSISTMLFLVFPESKSTAQPPIIAVNEATAHPMNILQACS